MMMLTLTLDTHETKAQILSADNGRKFITLQCGDATLILSGNSQESLAQARIIIEALTIVADQLDALLINERQPCDQCGHIGAILICEGDPQPETGYSDQTWLCYDCAQHYNLGEAQ